MSLDSTRAILLPTRTLIPILILVPQMIVMLILTLTLVWTMTLEGLGLYDIGISTFWYFVPKVLEILTFGSLRGYLRLTQDIIEKVSRGKYQSTRS